MCNGHFLGDSVSDKLSRNIAANLKRLREARHISQQRLSEVSRVPRPTLAHLESGVANPTLSVMLKVAEALQVRLEELLSQPPPAISHVKAKELKRRGRAGFAVTRLLHEASAGLGFERVQLGPRGRWSVKPSDPGQRYHVYCESGELSLNAGLQTCVLESGELAILSSEFGFTAQNATNRVAVAFRLIAPALHGA